MEFSSKDQEVLHFQIKRLIVVLFKNYLNSLEDIKEDHLDMLEKIESLLSSEDIDKLDLIDYLTENRYNFIRKKILDLGNDSIREFETILEKYEIEFKKTRSS